MIYSRQNILMARKGARVKKWYSATVLDIYDNEVLVSLPKLKGRAMRLGDSTPLEVSCVEGGVRYLFESAVRQKFGKEALVIDQPRLMEKIDLREYPRAYTNLEISYCEVGPEGNRAGCKKGFLMDISGSGVRIVADQIYSPGSTMSLQFSLPTGQGSLPVNPVNIEAKVVRVVVSEQKDLVEYQIGMKFSRVDRLDQDAIISYVNGRLNGDNNGKKG